jgi:hypothetical protein
MEGIFIPPVKEIFTIFPYSSEKLCRKTGSGSIWKTGNE